MRASYRDGDERTLQLLNRPNTDDPSFDTRFDWSLAVTDTLMKEVTAAGRGGLVASFTCSVSASEATKSIPRENFEALFHATDTRTGRSIPVINTRDAEAWGVSELPTGGAGGDVLAVGWRGTGEEKRLVIYPSGASGEIKVYYLRGIEQTPSPEESIDILDAFEMVLVPAGVGLYGMFAWRWDGKSAEETAAMKMALQDPRNPVSLVSLYTKQYNRFIDRIFNPFLIEPTVHATSRHARSQIVRHMGREV